MSKYWPQSFALKHSRIIFKHHQNSIRKKILHILGCCKVMQFCDSQDTEQEDMAQFRKNKIMFLC
jgi:hypothetical protein